MNEIERLTQRTKEIQQDLAKDRERKKLKPNQRMDDDVPQFLKSYDFWCDTCREDFVSSARKTSYRLDGHKISTIRGICPECGKEAIRYATHRDQDPYYNKSRKIRRQRNEYALDFLRADQYGFKTQYGEPYKEFIKRMIRIDKKKFKKRMEIGLKLNNIR